MVENYTYDAITHMIAYQVGNPCDLRFLGLLPGPPDLERKLYWLFVDEREHGEWFCAEGRLSEFLAALPRIFDGAATKA
jgi:hypothetical protein